MLCHTCDPLLVEVVVSSDIGYETYGGIDVGKIVGDNTSFIRLSASNVGDADGDI